MPRSGFLGFLLAKWDWPEPMTSYLALGWEHGDGRGPKCEGGERTRGRLLRTAINYIDPDDVGHYLVVGMGILA